MKTKLNFLLLMAVVLLTLVSCEQEGLQEFNGNASANFWIHSINRSFYGATPEEKPLDTITLKLAIVGYTTNYERSVRAEAYVPDKATMGEGQYRAEPGQYKILGGTIPPKSIYGEFKVEIKNEKRLAKDEIVLNLKIVENEHFGLGLRENQAVQMMWTAKMVRPETWNSMRFFFTPVYSTQAYKIIIQAMNGKTEFYYSGHYKGENTVSEAEGLVMGHKFGEIIRAYKEKHGKPMLHDDGVNANLPIEPIY